ncbi:MAG TPA: hypothetical protein VK116_10210, partial [Planctomycetota bacterium]|nr:hypothetical protein [Planctomycetota bacterium]
MPPRPPRSRRRKSRPAFLLRAALAALLAIAAQPFSSLARAEDGELAPDLARASWVWSTDESSGSAPSLLLFRRKLVLDQMAARASIAITADNGYELWVNGRRVGGDRGIDSDV